MIKQVYTSSKLKFLQHLFLLCISTMAFAAEIVEFPGGNNQRALLLAREILTAQRPNVFGIRKEINDLRPKGPTFLIALLDLILADESPWKPVTERREDLFYLLEDATKNVNPRTFFG